MRFGVCVLLLLWMASPASAAIVFNLLQQTPGPITIGTTATFRIEIFSDSGTINNLGGIDFFIDANDPGLTGTVVAGGTFSAGTNDLFAPNGGFALAFPSSYQVFGASVGVGLTLTGSPTTVATLNLDTTGATADTYNMNLSFLQAADPLFNTIPIGAGTTSLSYTLVAAGPVAAVPEPASATLLLSTSMAGFAFLKRRQSRQRRTPATSDSQPS